MTLKTVKKRTLSNKELLERRKHRFIFAGALLFLVTFTVRERVRDHAKERLDDLTTALNVFLMRSDSLKIPEQVMKDLSASKHAPRGAEIPGEQLERAVEGNLTNRLVGDTKYFAFAQATTTLAELIPLSEKDAETLRKLNERSDELGNRFKTVSDALINHQVTSEVYDSSVDLISSAGGFTDDAYKFGVLLSDHAAAERKRLEKRYRLVSDLSYLVMLLSWWVAFLGQNYDVDTEVAA